MKLGPWNKISYTQSSFCANIKLRNFSTYDPVVIVGFLTPTVLYAQCKVHKTATQTTCCHCFLCVLYWGQHFHCMQFHVAWAMDMCVAFEVHGLVEICTTKEFSINYVAYEY